MAGQKIQITITGVQYPIGAAEDEKVTTVQETDAEYFQKGDSFYLFYMEQPEGFPAPLRTRVKLKNNTLEIQRKGPGGSTMYFAPGQTYRTEYFTPYGLLLLDIVTANLVVGANIGMADRWPKVSVDYIIQNDGEEMARYHLTIDEK